MNEKIKEFCTQAVSGKMSYDAFYDKLCSAADDTRTDDDTACLLEDIIMELEMLHDEGSSKKVLNDAVKEHAERILAEL